MISSRFLVPLALMFTMTAPVAVMADASSLNTAVFGVGAVRDGTGQPIVRFVETSTKPESDAPRITRFRISRPATFSVSSPPSGVSLGRIQYDLGPRTLPAAQCCRTLSLRRRATRLGDGRYVLASARGARLVLSTRSRSSFLTLTLPSRAHNVSMIFKGAGARIFDVRGSCQSQRFTGYFTTATGVVHNTSTINARGLRAAALC